MKENSEMAIGFISLGDEYESIDDDNNPCDEGYFTYIDEDGFKYIINIEEEQCRQIKEKPYWYFNERVDKQKARYPSEWLDKIREDNKCPKCYGYKDEYEEGFVFKVCYPMLRHDCDLCNPPCNKCHNSRTQLERASLHSGVIDSPKIECSSCYNNRDIWRNDFTNFDKYKINVKCPKCFGNTIKYGTGESKKGGKFRKLQCKSENCGHVFIFENLYEQEILKERVRRLFAKGIKYRKIQTVEKVSRVTVSKWIKEWLHNLPQESKTTDELRSYIDKMN